nr:MAG TPA: hypothetical protein [Caudoviricetes sp.]
MEYNYILFQIKNWLVMNGREYLKFRQLMLLFIMEMYI